MTHRDLVAEELDAQLREADTRLEALQAQAHARQARDEMAEISGLRAARERARHELAAMKREVSKDFDASRRAVQTALQDLEVGIDRVRDRYHAWDAARERHLYARLDEADAKLREWKASADQWKEGRAMERHDALATLEESIALARARAAEWNRDRHEREAETALEEAALHFDEAFDAAATRYDR